MKSFRLHSINGSTLILQHVAVMDTYSQAHKLDSPSAPTSALKSIRSNVHRLAASPGYVPHTGLTQTADSVAQISTKPLHYYIMCLGFEVFPRGMKVVT